MIRVSELSGADLDYWVATVLGTFAYIYKSYTGTTHCVTTENGKRAVDDEYEIHLSYSTNWSLGGPLIEGRKISVIRLSDDTTWQAVEHGGKSWSDGKTPLEAAMRALVVSKYGAEVTTNKDIRCRS